jgi:hypothetical protein
MIISHRESLAPFYIFCNFLNTVTEKNCQHPDNPAIENGSLEINVHRSGGFKPGSVATYHCNPVRTTESLDIQPFRNL